MTIVLDEPAVGGVAEAPPLEREPAEDASFGSGAGITIGVLAVGALLAAGLARLALRRRAAR